MNEHAATISIRALSTTFIVVALAIFKPFGLEAWQWQAYVHLGVIWVLGVMVCMATDLILKYVLRMPRSLHEGVSYIIRRNLWFQLINTPLVTVVICLYRHYMLSDRVPDNQLSLAGFVQTLVIIGFCSFVIGLYWRFKFRSRFLIAELEETKRLNEELKLIHDARMADATTSESDLQTSAECVSLTGNTAESVSFCISDLLYIEAVGNYAKVFHLVDGTVRTDMLRATLKQIEESLRAYPVVVRCHRAFLVNLAQVEQIVSHSGSMQLHICHCNDSIPVSRSNMSSVKAAIKEKK